MDTFVVNWFSAQCLYKKTTLEYTWHQVHVGVRDSAANMISAMRHANICHVSCTAHTLQLVLHYAIFTQTSVEAVVKGPQNRLAFQTQRASM